MLTLKGTPRALDPLLKPVVRGAAWLVGGGVSTALACYGAWWWAPLPLAMGLLGAEGWSWRRSDRPCTLGLSAERLLVRDPLQDRERSIPLESLHTATLFHRRAPGRPGFDEVVVVLASREQVRLALPFRIPSGSIRFSSTDVDIDRADALLGGIAGVIRATVPTDHLFRQTLTDPEGIAWLQRHLPPALWERTTVRAWRGAAPALNLFGYHEGPPDVLLSLGPDGITRRDLSDGSVSTVPWSDSPFDIFRSERTATLLTSQGTAHTELTERLPLLCLTLAEGLTVAIPAPTVDPALPFRLTDDARLHLHGPGGAAILWHLAHLAPYRVLSDAILSVLRDNAAHEGEPVPASRPGP